MTWTVRIVLAAVGILAVAALFLRFGAVQRMRAPKPLDLPGWASATCGATEAFENAMRSTRDNIDPQTLDLAARKERAQKVGKGEIEAARNLAKALREVNAPDAVEKYHRALTANADEYAAAVTEQVAAIAKAANAQQIAVANASARFRLQSSDQEVNAAAAELPRAALDALRAEPKCHAQGGDMPATPSAQRAPAGSPERGARGLAGAA
jgi:hypothetical protein